MNRIISRLFSCAVLVAVLATVFAGSLFAQVTSGTTYSTPSISGLPTGWNGSDGGGTSYIKLTASTHYVQTPSFSQNGFTSIKIKARKFGGPSDAQALITVSWYSNDEETVLGTVVPTSTSLSDYTISSPNNPTGNTTGYIKIQCKDASSGKGSGISEVTITYTASGGGSSTYTVTYDANGGSGSMTDTSSPYDEGSTVTVMDNEFTRTYYTFSKWNTAADGSGVEYDSGDTFTIDANTTLYAQWSLESGINMVSLTQSSLELTGSYSSGTSKTIGGITYQHTDLQKNSLTIQAKATTGTIKNTTPFPGKILMLVVNHSGTARATTINGSSDGADWSEVESGSGTITADFSAYNYKYFQITRGSNAAYWENIQIYWKDTNVARPSFSIAPGAYTSTQNVTISCETDGATIYYTTDGTDPSELNGTEGNSVTISTTTTLKAIAIKGGESSEIAIGIYSFPYTTIPSLFSAATLSSTPVNVTFGNWVVSGVNGNQVFITDGSNGLIVYQSGHGFAVGNTLSGTVSCNLVLYNGAAEITGLTSSTEGLTVVTGGSVSPVTTSIGALSAVNTGSVVTLNNLTYNGSVLSDGVNSITPGNSLYNELALVSDKQYNVTGVFVVNNTTKRILPRSAADIAEVVVPSISLSSTSIEATASETEGTITVTCNNMTGDVMLDVCFYEADGTTPATYSWIDADINGANNVEFLISANDGSARTAYFKVYGIDEASHEVYSALVTVTQSAYVAPPSGDQYSLYTGSLVEGDYVIYYGGKAMNNVVNTDRLQYEEVTPTGDNVITEDASIVWHIAPSGDYWTIYSPDADAYAAGTGVKNKAQMLVDGTDDKSLWTVSGTDTYEFVNKANEANSVNKTLRNNGTYGFACYAIETGGPLTLYKRSDVPASIEISATANGGRYWATFYNSAARFTLPSGAKAFTMNDSHELFLLGTDGTVVPANTAVIIIADSDSITLTKSNSAEVIAVNGGANILRGSNYPVDVTGTPYVLGIVGSVLGFYEYTGTAVPANKAYYVE